MTKQMLKGICVGTKDELVTRIYKYFEEINADYPEILDFKRMITIESHCK